ncbi:MAG: hypothetical protein AAF636_19350 [Pseudomonadota bacterium]
MTLDQLTKSRNALLEARFRGARRFRDQNGEEVEFRSDAEMARALAALDAEIANASGAATPRILHFITSTGT